MQISGRICDRNGSVRVCARVWKQELFNRIWVRREVQSEKEGMERE